MSETEATTSQELERTIQYPIALDVINNLATVYMPLKIDGINDKDGQTAVGFARRNVKKHRVAVEHKRKALKADALAYGKKVDFTAKLLTGELLKIESHLIAEETTVKDEIARITQEEEKRKRALLQGRLDMLAAVGCMMNPTDIESMDDNEFDRTLGLAVASFNIKRLEEAKQEREAEETERQHKAEGEHLAAERKKLEEEKAELDAEKAKIEAEKQRVENERLEVERKAADASWREECEQRHREAEERERKRAAEKAEQEAKAEQERQEQLEAMRPDLEKLAGVASTLDVIRVPKVASDDAQPKREQVITVLHAAAAQIRRIVKAE